MGIAIRHTARGSLLPLLLAGGLGAEPIVSIGGQRSAPQLAELRAALRAAGAGELERSAFLEPFASVRLPLCCARLDLSYQYYAGDADSGDLSLSLHDIGLAAGLVFDPFKVSFAAGGGGDLLFLHQDGEVRVRGSERRFDRLDWAVHGVLGATWEFLPRWGLDLRGSRRWRARPRIQGVVYDASGRTLAVGLAYYLR